MKLSFLAALVLVLVPVAAPLSAQERRAPAAQAESYDSLESRVEVLRTARAAHLERGNERAVAELDAGLRYAKLRLAGTTGEQLEAAVREVPATTRLIELLDQAASAYDGWKREDDARRCRALAKVYRSWSGTASPPEDSAKERTPRPDASPRLADRGARMKILRLARAAHAEAGDRESVATMDRILVLAELQMEEASDEKIAEAAQGLTQQRIIELVAQAADRYAAWGNAERAKLCAELVAYYQSREGEQRVREPQALNLAVRADRIRILEVVRDVYRRQGDRKRLEAMERILRFAAWEEAGSDPATLGDLAEGLSRDSLLELLERASGTLREWGAEDRAQACRALLAYYRDQEPGAADERREVDPRDLRIRRLLQRVEQLEAELAEVRAQLRSLAR